MARRPVEESPVRLTKQQRAYKRAARQLSRRVRELRYMRGWSYADLSEASGVNQRQLIRLENQGEDANPTFATLSMLADAFGVELRELLSPPQSGIRVKQTPGAAVQADKVLADKASAGTGSSAVVRLSTKKSAARKKTSSK